MFNVSALYPLHHRLLVFPLLTLFLKHDRYSDATVYSSYDDEVYQFADCGQGVAVASGEFTVKSICTFDNISYQSQRDCHVYFMNTTRVILKSLLSRYNLL